MPKKPLKLNVLPVLVGLMLVAVLVPSGFADDDLKPVIQQALDAQDTSRAIDLIQKEIDLDPSYFFNYYILGKIYFDREEYNKARTALTTAVDKKSKDWDSVYLLGRTLLILGHVDEAEKYLSEGLKKTKKKPEFSGKFEYGLGLVAMTRENYKDADLSFRKALEIEPNNADFRIALGDANFKQGIAPLAVIEYEKALKLDTASTEVYFHWAEACLTLKDYACAIEKLQTVLSKDSTYAQAWNRAAGIYYKAARSSRSREERKARFIDAIGSYKRYLELTNVQPDSDHVRPFFESAMAYNSVYGFEDAVPFFEKVLSIPMEPRDIYFEYGKALWGIKDYVKSGEMLLKHEEWVANQDERYHSTIGDDEYYRLLGDSYFYRKPKDWSTARRYYMQSLAVDPEQKRLLQNVAISFHTSKRYGEALEYYDKRIALGIDSNSYSILKNAGLCALGLAGAEADEEELMDEEMMDEEEEEVQQATSYAPDVNFYELALDYMNKYLDYDPQDTTVLLRVANTYLYQLQDCANGVSSFEKLLTLTPNSCLAKKSLGYAYFGGVCTQNYSKAIRNLKNAYECLSSSEGSCADPALVKWIAQAYHLRAVEPGNDNSNDDYKNAYEWYGRVLKCNPSDSEAKKGQDDTRFEFN